jgi:GGDEF domain-containing protein
MRSSFRFQDQLYRFGGEEFVVLIRCGAVEQAHAAFERLRSNVESYIFPRVGRITVSVGFTQLRRATHRPVPSSAPTRRSITPSRTAATRWPTMAT